MRRIHTVINVGILVVMVAMVIGALRNEWRGGSLDDLSAEEIARRVGG